MEIGEEVINSLREDAGPIDRIDGAESMCRIEIGIGEERFDDVL